MNPLFTKNLLQWNAGENTRSMPWKGEKDPYKIWLSEIILQQTRVEQGLAYYHKFVDTYPTIHQLAAAPDQQVFKLWEGLGYYTRCKNLLQTARYVSQALNGRFPETYDSIKTLKGIGPYTAAAIASFAFNQPHAVVDGNVTRVLARYFGVATPVNSSAGKKLFSQVAESLLPRNEPAAFNQAIMDFGAVICKPKQPLCNICVHSNACEAFRHGWIAVLPAKDKKPPRTKRVFNYYVIESEDSVYIRKRSGKDIWENLYEFVLEEPELQPYPGLFNDKQLKSILGPTRADITGISDTFSQQLTHQTIEGRFISVRIYDPLFIQQGYRPVLKNDLANYPFPRFITSWLAEKASV